MAKKKQLNPETEYYVAALKIAIGLDKDAMVVWHNNYMYSPTPTGTIAVPCNFSCNVAVKAKDLVNALSGCDTSFMVTEQINQVIVAWGRKKAVLNSMPRVSIFVRELDRLYGMPQVPPQFTEVLRAYLKDLPANSNEVYSQVLKFTSDAAYWTDRKTIAKIDVGTWMPDALLWVKDLRGALSKEGNIVAIFYSQSTMTFYWQDGFGLQLPLVDDSAVKLPDMSAFFNPELFEAEYALTEEHVDALEFVAKFSDDVIFIEPTFVGTSNNPHEGTKVDTTDLPIQTQIFASSVKLGALKNATSLMKFTNARDAVAFMAKREHFMFIFSRARRN